MQRLIDNFKPHNIFLIWEDCEIQEHCYTETYNIGWVGLWLACVPANPPCLRQFNHSDGIDIYFGGNNVGVSYRGGWTQGVIPSTIGRGIIIAGQFWEAPYPNLIDTDVLTHEMGHALGLFHTFHPWPSCDPCHELVDMSNCEMCGDLVCDTPADPYGATLFDLDPEECEYDTNGDLDCNDDPFDPDETNYMSYTHSLCLSSFTPCQAERMRYMIATSGSGGPNFGVLNARRFYFDEVDPDISVNTTWDNSSVGSQVTIKGNLTISSGYTLTLGTNTSIRFSEDSKLIIEPNATLQLHGTLTGFCGKSWQGVEVQGNDASYSQFIVNDVRSQGQIVFHSGSLIENAVIGVQLWGPTKDKAGGQLKGSQGTIKNCYTGIEYAPYENFWPFSTPSGQQGQPRNYIGSLREFTFLNDNDYVINDFPFNAFVKMVGVNGITVSACTFTKLQDINGGKIENWGYGIHASDAGFYVVPKCLDSNPYPDPCINFAYCEFYGLGFGVHALRQIKNRPFTVQEANFENCFVGIRNVFVSGSAVILNNFKMGDLPSTVPTGSQVGYELVGAIAGLICEENTFDSDGSNEEVASIGIIAQGTGTSNKAIRRNEFRELNYGSIASYKNAATSGIPIRGLYFDCNRNYDALELDLSVLIGPIKQKQGLEKPDPSNPTQVVYAAAGNRFTNGTVDFDNSSDQLEYFYKTSGINENPNSTGNITETPSNIPNTCSVTFCAPPCLTPADITIKKADFNSNQSSFNSVRSSYLANPTAAKQQQLSFYQRIMDEDAFMIALHEMYDTTTYHQDTLRVWVEKMKSFEGDFMLAGEWLRRGNISNSLAVLDSIISRNQLIDADEADIELCKDIVQLLDGANVYSLHPDTIDLMKGFLETGGLAERWAKSILMANGYHFPPVIDMPGSSEPYIYKPSNLSSIQGNELKKVVSSNLIDMDFLKINEESIRVYPNPATEQVTFSIVLPNNVFKYSIIIYDGNGSMIDQKNEIAAEDTYVWNTRDQSSGLYIYKVWSDSKFVTGGKIVLLK